jgi:ribonuclease E/ribonuclease G
VADIAAEAAALAAIGREGEVRAPDAFRRLVTDYGLPEPDSITVAGRVAEGVVKRWCEAFALRLLSRVAVGEAGLFDAHDLDRAIEALVQPCVLLPRSGSLIIEPTAALVAIDVNAGAGSNALAANLAATSEIARHLRLRHLGGIIVIDFISMSRPADRARVTASLAAALADDPAQTHILPMSALGLVEMTRERRGPGLPA